MKASVMQALKAHRAQADQSGSVRATKDDFESLNTTLFGVKGARLVAPAIAMRLTKPNEKPPASKVITIGESPEGFGKAIAWAPTDAGIAAVIYLHAGDPLGVMISGVRRGDTIQFVHAAGICSFAEDTENEGVGALIGLVAAGASVAATAFGAPQAAPLIEAGAEFAKTQFKEEKVKTKRRDPFGEDPSTGHKARQEGGVLVSMPRAGRIYYSGNGNTKEKWVQEPGTRDDAHRPSHVKHAFFLQTGRDHRTAGGDGDIIIYPWDHNFEDNFGFYRLHVLLTRGNEI